MFKKDFWKYFIKTYAEAKWLVLRYLIVAIYLTVSSIIANKMNLENLTYFNAIIAISYFADLIGFGVSNGVGIYINQNINNKEKVDYYIKLGLYINFIVSIIFVIILASCYYPILHLLLGLSKNIKYSFYFIMLIYIFMLCTLNYFIHTFKELKMFLSSLIISIIQCILIIVGFILVWLCFDLSLTLIPYIYIITTLIAIIFCLIYFNKNSYYKINIFKFIKVKLTKEEFKIIWQLAGTQIIWQIGSTLLSYYILKSNKIIFNQYSYFENILDIFNGFYYSFVTITSIDICRNLGQSKFDETYKIGKYSIYANFVIWFIYFILSIAFFIPIKSGMSIDIQSQVFLSLVLYITLHLFRFISWNIFSYIVCWGGKVKLIFWQEVVITFYFLILYLIASYLPSNIFFIYFLIFIPPFVQTILGFIVFKKKDWMHALTNKD